MYQCDKSHYLLYYFNYCILESCTSKNIHIVLIIDSKVFLLFGYDMQDNFHYLFLDLQIFPIQYYHHYLLYLHYIVYHMYISKNIKLS